MSLAFLAKKSWHTANLRNVEKVWIAEQKHAAEEKKVAELKKNIEEERQLQELRELQAKHSGNKNAAIERLDWLYEAPMANSAGQPSTEEYLLGKEYKDMEDGNSQLKTLESKATYGSLQLNKAALPSNDTFSRLNEDPMMLIRRKQKQLHEEVLKNPLKMKKIKKQIDSLRQERKEKKKAKKEKKREKKRARQEQHSSNDENDESRVGNKRLRERSPSSSRDKEVYHRNDKERRSSDRKSRRSSLDRRNSRHHYRPSHKSDRNNRNSERYHSTRSRSNNRSRNISRSRSGSRGRHGSKDRHRSYRYKEDKYQRHRSRSGSYHRENKSRNSVRESTPPHESKPHTRDYDYDSNSKYGLVSTKDAICCESIDSTSLGPNQKHIARAREKKKQEEQEIREKLAKRGDKGSRYRSNQQPKLSHEEMKQRAEQMRLDGQLREDMLRSQLQASKSKHEKEDQESKPSNQKHFLREVHDNLYSNTKDSMENRLRRNANYIQRHADASNFISKE